MVVQAYAVCIRVTPECRRMESEMIGDGWGHADEADEAYHNTEFDVQVSLYSDWGVICTIADKLQSDFSPHSLTSVCAVSDISCASTLKPSLIRGKVPFCKEILCLHLAVGKKLH